MSNRERIIRLIYEAIDEFNLQHPPEERLEKSAESVLFGPSGRLDSLGLVDLILACTGRPQVAFILKEPRRALRQAQLESLPAWDPRLSTSGNRVLRQLGSLLGGLGRMENWLRHRGRADLAPCDRGVLSPSLMPSLFSTCATISSAPRSMQEMFVQIETSFRPQGLVWNIE